MNFTAVFAYFLIFGFGINLVGLSPITKILNMKGLSKIMGALALVFILASCLHHPPAPPKPPEPPRPHGR